jgi:hypothetical protein
MLTINDFKDYLQDQFKNKPVIQKLESFIQEGKSKAGKRHEEVFTREFLCPVIRTYFSEHVRSQLNLSDDEIKKGLGTEGFRKCDGFGFTPARKKKHLFAKNDIIKPVRPESWLAKNRNPLPRFQACPDFAILFKPHIAVVGEVKYFKTGAPMDAVNDLYNAARQAAFYLGAFHGIYTSTMIVVADGSHDHTFHEGKQLVKPELLQRFGEETDIHLVTLELT